MITNIAECFSKALIPKNDNSRLQSSKQQRYYTLKYESINNLVLINMDLINKPLLSGSSKIILISSAFCVPHSNFYAFTSSIIPFM